MDLNVILAIPEDNKGRQQGNQQEKILGGLKWGSKLIWVRLRKGKTEFLQEPGGGTN